MTQSVFATPSSLPPATFTVRIDVAGRQNVVGFPPDVTIVPTAILEENISDRSLTAFHFDLDCHKEWAILSTDSGSHQIRTDRIIAVTVTRNDF